MSTPPIGFIGLGGMGSAMSGQLLAAKLREFSGTTWSRRE